MVHRVLIGVELGKDNYCHIGKKQNDAYFVTFFYTKTKLNLEWREYNLA